MSNDGLSCDVLVIGSGAGGLSTAITAKKYGLNPVVIEKADVFGGTTAFSGGVLWIPLNAHAKATGRADDRAAVKTYMKGELGNFFDDRAVDAYLDRGPEMVDFFERETSVKFVPTLYPDYHSNREGAVQVGRAIVAAPYDATGLGPDLKRLRPPLETISFIGMMFNSSNADLTHFFNATRSLTSFIYVVKRLARHMIELVRYRRGVQVTSGNALAARLAKSALDLGIPIMTSTPAKELIRSEGRIVGAIVEHEGRSMRIVAKHGVVLACGGFPHDTNRMTELYPHVARGGEHFSPTPKENTGDGIRLGEQAGGLSKAGYPNAAAWMPTSKVPLSNGRTGAFPHLLDRCKAGVIAINKAGKRFVNESESYHDVGAAMIATCDGERETVAWLICDHVTIRKYGLGYAKPAPIPLGPLIRKGYLFRASTLEQLANQISVDGAALVRTVRDYNATAQDGNDPQFRRGTSAFNRYLADPAHQPNPCVGPLERAPFYAVKLIMGDLGTFEGLKTDVVGRVLDHAENVIPGLYAVGNDRASIMGGSYPGAGITLGPIMTFGYVTGRHLAGLAE
ncbi:MAG: FAD-dependent oxidoreductase [Pseudolabrys sp.]|jgi:succinate dehydrogenase/fumarate reductase flavoprotein subunit